MPATTRPDFGANTEAIDVAKEFASNIHGRVVLVTGLNIEGIGFTTAQAIASQSPKMLILASRTPAKIQKCIDALKAEYPDVEYRQLLIDLSSQQSVRKAAEEVLAWEDVPHLDVMINSAGVMAIQERTLNAEGIEMHFATNHIGHFLLACLLMPKLLKAAENSLKGATRIINVSSASPMVGTMRWSDINFDKTNKDLPQSEQPKYEWLKMWGHPNAAEEVYVPVDAYNRSKVANLLFSVALNQRLNGRGIVSLAVHPGVIETELQRNFPPQVIQALMDAVKSGRFGITPKTQGAGAATSLVAGFDPKLGDVSKPYDPYLDDCQVNDKALPEAKSVAEAEKLWKLSEDLVGQQFSW